MYLLGLGIILLAMKYLEFGPVAEWSWWAVMAPFGLAAVWWTWADYSGYTKRKAVQRETERKEARLERQRQNMGMGPKKGSRR
jgi:small Trp-rich protein